MHRFFCLLLIAGSTMLVSCGEEDSQAPTVIGITANVQEIAEGEQFAITLRTDTPNRTGTDISVPFIYEGIALEFIDGSEITPVIQQDQEFNSLLLIVNNDPDTTGDRTLVVRIDETQIPAGLTLGNSSVTITIQD